MGCDDVLVRILGQFSAGDIVPDGEQLAVARRLAEWVGDPPRVHRAHSNRRGIFLWGGVGRGKTRLLDATVATLPPGVACRWHQLAFLDAFHRCFAGPARHDFAAAIDALVGSARLLAFDEFHIHDIADAQILQRTFNYLSARGVRLLVTANPPPAAFAESGLRQRHFAPLIHFLEAWCESIELAGDVDYRRAGGPGERRWRIPDNAGTRQDLLARLEALSRRTVSASFDALCRAPRCHADYMRLAEADAALAIWGIPRFGVRDGDAVRRLVWLADACWERQVPMAVSAALPAETIFTHIGDRGAVPARELARAESRLIALCGLSPQGFTTTSAIP